MSSETNEPIGAARNLAPAIAFENVTCSFETPEGVYTATKDVSFSIGDGEFVSVVGPTGCGKSTLLNAAAGLLKPAAGRVLIYGEALNGINHRAGYMFQAESLMPWATAIDNVMMSLKFRGVPENEAREAGFDWLERVGLERFADRYPHELSGGMRKRVAMAQTMIADPDILLMDESFSALDIQTRQLMENELLELWQAKKKAVLFITHDLDEAIAMSDRVVVMSAGPASHPLGSFPIAIPRPRNVAEIRTRADFNECYSAIWEVLREEVLKSYREHRAHVGTLAS
ncbi:ABC transporter ATP-binding protein [Sutterella wadsworthensis]|uniref:ABC transporter ATP-binding protein n=1 Tax=Sutterella wadsworthensis TaxID=40545 RepID=UPI001EC15EFF|nr:ABC transporter ATP-binding protein [Sutterella wadsworthensis]MBD8910058.1 ABC transporter ATP-binding protein [Sutterella wadsworthensis]